MSHRDEIALQEADDEAYERWLKGTPEYWAELTDTLTANIIVPDRDCESFTVTGVIETREDVDLWANADLCSWCGAPGPHRAVCYNCGH
ncbi:MAG: hypothetical protein ACWGQW_01670 [bacterium]